MRLRLASLVLLLAALGGCSLLWPRRVAPRYYSIGPPALAPRAAEPADLTLAVRPLDSGSRYRERILYRTPGNPIGYHESDRWVEPPAEMVTSVLRRALQAARVARVVADGRVARRADVTLEGRLTRFDEVQARDGWAAECEIELVLKQSDSDELLHVGYLAARRPAKGKTTPSFVEAMDAAAAEVTARAVDAVAKGLAKCKPKPK